MLVSVFNCQKKFPICSKSVKILLIFLCDYLKIATDHIDIRFVSDRKIRKDHEMIFNDPSPTDVISLPIDPPGSESFPSVLGELIVCPEFAFNYIKAKHLDSDNPYFFYRELTLYIVHGLLHLIGYDDILVSDKQKMQRRQRTIMLHLEKEMVLVKAPTKRRPPTSIQKE
ncbi:rRNA maturation RNase YbeY [Candidatus Clavichlamydia salmonicola]|uniref:rRNA maturation RNase YbeY n=1 Tax=Candidatus Clavichlamydia salmonicola TaxID=469812 RepID=UPI001891133B|nr:rRNA maturation RNase YbeY [Candidatus Clavichlamydia salmonicola]